MQPTIILRNLDLSLKALNSLTVTDAPIQYVRVLIAINAHEGISVAEVGKVVGLTSSTTSRSVAYWEKLGLVRKEQDPTERRRMFVSLTKQGTNAIDALIQPFK